MTPPGENDSLNHTIVVSGVAGSGKTTIGMLLADRLNRPFLDADSLHPDANVQKMAAGTPLTDTDRWPWLDAVGRTMAQGDTVVACSALRREYRTRLRQWVPDAIFVQLTADQTLVGARLLARSGHFMPASLLPSQYALLEPLTDDERGAQFDVAAAPHALVDHILDYLATETAPIDHDRRP